MRLTQSLKGIAVLSCFFLTLSACTHHTSSTRMSGYLPGYKPYSPSVNYASRIPNKIDTKGKKTVVVYPREHVWGAYGSNGELVRAGIATAGGDWCEDTGRPCRTSVGTFRISSLGSEDCRSSKYPKPNGGGLMPYCMFFHGDQALHGSPDPIVVEGNLSHGCVRMRIPDAEWLRFNFAQVGTKVIVNPY